MARAATFTEASARRIAEVVKRVERDGGGGVRRRGKFDDNGAADTDVSFRVSARVDNSLLHITVASGHAWYWFHDNTAGLGIGYQPVATYTSSEITAGSAAVEKFFCVSARAVRTIGSPDTYSIAIDGQYVTASDTEADAIAAAAAGGWNGATDYTANVPLAVINTATAAVVRVLHEGDIFFRDDPKPGSRTVSLSGVWPGWKMIASVGGNNVQGRYLRLNGTAAEGIGGNATHAHAVGATAVTVDNNLDASTVEINTADPTSGSADNDPLYMDAIVIEKL